MTRPRSRHLFLVVLLAALLMQAAWILALPAFRGIDEFEHVYKAEAVAHGQLRDQGAAASGRGNLVTVPDDIVAAASKVCAAYSYTRHDNCHPAQHLGGGMVSVASAASTYNPAYYAVVGLVARPFSGAAADFAMRACTALLAALLLAWAAVATAAWARNAWPLVALLVSATPVLVYSTAVASPNGVGYAAACLLWAAGLGLVEDLGRPRVFALVTAATTMMVTHTTGMLWLGCVVLVVALLQPFSAWRSLFRSSPRALTASAAVIGLVGLACLTWIRSANTNAIPSTGEGAAHPSAGDLVAGQISWAVQTIAAFPLRNEPAPAVVYALWLVPFGILLVMGFRRASHRLRLAGLLLLAMWVVIPVALSWIAFASEGLFWQGRYALPLAVGFPALAGLALSRTDRLPRAEYGVLIVPLCALAQAISVVRIAWRERDTGLAPTFADVGTPVAIGLVVTLALVGGLLPLLLGRMETDEDSAQARGSTLTRA